MYVCVMCIFFSVYVNIYKYISVGMCWGGIGGPIDLATANRINASSSSLSARSVYFVAVFRGSQLAQVLSLFSHPTITPHRSHTLHTHSQQSRRRSSVSHKTLHTENAYIYIYIYVWIWEGEWEREWMSGSERAARAIVIQFAHWALDQWKELLYNTKKIIVDRNLYNGNINSSGTSRNKCSLDSDGVDRCVDRWNGRMPTCICNVFNFEQRSRARRWSQYDTRTLSLAFRKRFAVTTIYRVVWKYFCFGRQN